MNSYKPSIADIDSINSSIDVFLNLKSLEIPEVIYHYTSIQGVEGILKNQEIWATNINYLNDAEEYIHTIKLAEKHIKKTEFSDLELKEIFLKVLKAATPVFEPIFVTSFSTDPDVLSQWRAYCPDGGYAIGFFGQKLSEQAELKNFNLGRCIYNSEEKNRILSKIIEEQTLIFNSADTDSPTKKMEIIQHIEFRFKILLSHIATLFKHESFSEEKEWRLFSQPQSYFVTDAEFRIKKSLLVPYFKINLSKENTLKNIYIGPMEHKELAMNSLMPFIANQAKNISTFGCHYSKTPYRKF